MKTRGAWQLTPAGLARAALEAKRAEAELAQSRDALRAHGELDVRSAQIADAAARLAELDAEPVPSTRVGVEAEEGPRDGRRQRRAATHRHPQGATEGGQHRPRGQALQQRRFGRRRRGLGRRRQRRRLPLLHAAAPASP
jgi:hypothetical protein